MKKFAALLISVTLLMALTLCASASLSSATKCTLSDTKVEVGKTVTVTVSVENCPQFQYAGISLEYDTGIFKLISAEWTVKDTVIKDFRTDKNEGVIAYKTQKDSNGEIFKFTLQAKAQSVFDNNSISAKLLPNSADNTPITVTAKKTPITIIATQTQSTTDASTETTVATNADDTTNTHETDNGKPAETTGKTQTDDKAPDDTADDGGDILGSGSNKALIIIIASIVGLLAIGVCIYTRFKDNF